jgi:hypothetical protein
MDKKWKAWADASKGQLKHAETTTIYHGDLTAKEYAHFMKSSLAAQNLLFQYDSHPEHFGFESTPEKTWIYETFGHGHQPSKFYL